MVNAVCGELIGEPYGFELECGLDPDHEGDHHAEVTWPRAPRREPGPPSEMGLLMQRIWGPSILDQLARMRRLGG